METPCSAEQLVCPLRMTNSNTQAALAHAEDLYRDVKVIEAYRHLRMLRLCTKERRVALPRLHQNIYQRGKRCEESVQDLLQPPDARPEDGWIKQGESHTGAYPTEIYYKIDRTATNNVRLTCRVETPIPQSLLIPLLSVLNESELYPEWFPSSTSPRMGILRSTALERRGRADQVLQIITSAPWPFSNREVLLETTVFDDIEHNGLFGVLLGTAASRAGPVPEDVVRVGFDGTLLFRPCPVDHPLLAKKKGSVAGTEPKILVSFKM